MLPAYLLKKTQIQTINGQTARRFGGNRLLEGAAGGSRERTVTTLVGMAIYCDKISYHHQKKRFAEAKATGYSS